MFVRSSLVALVPALFLGLVPHLADAQSAPDFDRGAASKALDAVDLAFCKVTSRNGGEGHATIVFEPGGTTSSVVVDRGPFVSTPIGRCVASKYSKVHVPPFAGPAVKVGKSFRID